MDNLTTSSGSGQLRVTLTRLEIELGTHDDAVGIYEPLTFVPKVQGIIDYSIGPYVSR